jgi:predicted ester cyclase
LAVRYVFEADHTGELLGIGATGKRVYLPGIFIARIEDGKLAEYWREEDQLSMMQLLGAILSPEQAGV